MAKKKRTLEEFFQKPGNLSAEDFKERSNYVEIEPEDRKEKKVLEPKTLSKEEQAKAVEVLEKEPEVSSSGAINIVGVVADEEPKKQEKKAPEPLKTPKKIPRNLIPAEESIVSKPEVKEEAAPVAERQPASDSDSSFPWSRALVGATPLLVGLLTGNELEGAQVASEHVIKDEGDLVNRERDLASKLNELAKKKELGVDEGGKRRFTDENIEIEDPNAPGGVRTVKAVFDSFTGSFQYPDGSPIPNKIIRAGYAVGQEEARARIDYNYGRKSEYHEKYDEGFTDPRTGERAFARNGEIIPARETKIGELNVKQEKDIEKVLAEVKGSEVVKTSVPILEKVQRVYGLLGAATRKEDPNYIAGAGAVVQVARMLQGPGVLTDRDLKEMGGSQQVYEALNRIIGRLGNGEALTFQDAKDLKEILSVAEQGARRRLGGYLDDKSVSAAKRYGIHPEVVRDQIGVEILPFLNKGSTIVSEFTAKPIKYNGEEHRSTNPRTHTVPVLHEGAVKWMRPQDYERMKDEVQRIDQ